MADKANRRAADHWAVGAGEISRLSWVGGGCLSSGAGISDVGTSLLLELFAGLKCGSIMHNQRKLSTAGRVGGVYTVTS